MRETVRKIKQHFCRHTWEPQRKRHWVQNTCSKCGLHGPTHFSPLMRSEDDCEGLKLKNTLTWVEGTHVSTDDDNGPMEGIPLNLKAWRAGPYTIIRQRSENGLFLLRGRTSGIGLAVSSLEEAKAAAETDYIKVASGYNSPPHLIAEDAAPQNNGRMPESPRLERLLAAAKVQIEAMSEAEIDAMLAAQRESWVRGEMQLDRKPVEPSPQPNVVGLRAALEEIVNPIAAMRLRAEGEGGKLDGMMANVLARDPEYLKGIARAALAATEALPNVVGWQDMAAAPKDGTMLRLLVVPDQEEFTAFDDSLTPYETIGSNNLADTQDDRWEFAGWDWQQDRFITGRGEVIGWSPFAARRSDPIRDAVEWCLERDQRNGTLPEAYAERLRSALTHAEEK